MDGKHIKLLSIVNTYYLCFCTLSFVEYLLFGVEKCHKFRPGSWNMLSSRFLLEVHSTPIDSVLRVLCTSEWEVSSLYYKDHFGLEDIFGLAQ